MKVRCLASSRSTGETATEFPLLVGGLAGALFRVEVPDSDLNVIRVSLALPAFADLAKYVDRWRRTHALGICRNSCSP